MDGFVPCCVRDLRYEHDSSTKHHNGEVNKVKRGLCL